MRCGTTHRSVDPSITPRPSSVPNGCRALDVWREAREEYRRVEVFERLDLEPGPLDGRDGVPVGVAAGEEPPPEGRYAILPAGYGPRGADMLDKQQLPIRAQDAPYLP